MRCYCEKPRSTSHWKGFANENDPYVAPYSLWAAFILEVLNVTKARL